MISEAEESSRNAPTALASARGALDIAGALIAARADIDVAGKRGAG